MIYNILNNIIIKDQIIYYNNSTILFICAFFNLNITLNIINNNFFIYFYYLYVLLFNKYFII
jgi:hypothetical protein